MHAPTNNGCGDNFDKKNKPKPRIEWFLGKRGINRQNTIDEFFRGETNSGINPDYIVEWVKDIKAKDIKSKPASEKISANAAIPESALSENNAPTSQASIAKKSPKKDISRNALEQKSESPEALFDKAEKLYGEEKYSEAFRYYKLAADEGHTKAQ